MHTATEFAQHEPQIARLVAKGTDKLIRVSLATVKRAQQPLSDPKLEA